MDIEGPTVARTPQPAAAWDDLPYKGVTEIHLRAHYEAHTGVPTWVSEVNYDAFTDMPYKAEMEAELKFLFASPPSYEDFG